MAVIMGIDPGSRFAGYGIVKSEGEKLTALDFGTLKLKGDGLAERLSHLMAELDGLLEKHKPDSVVVERVFLGKNADSAFKLGHARGICLAMIARSGSLLAEYTPREAKQRVTGHGGAAKEHVALVVEQTLSVRIADRLDATDALALAICHARELSRRKLMEKVLS